MSEATYRISRDVVPKTYEIDLSTSPRRKGFSGTLHATAQVVRATEVVTLHGRALNVKEAFATLGRRKLPAKVRIDAAAQTIELRFGEALPKGEVGLTLVYAGTLDVGLNGLYLAKSGAERAIASQCEAAEARAIFPCWDEPDLKASLQWTVRTDPGLAVVTNGVPRSKRRDPKTGQDVHRFEPTPVISTYLATVTVGHYDSTPVRQVRGTPCRVLAPRGKIEQAAFAEEVTDFVLPWFVDYFAQRYHYGKLDQVALPAFDAGAMENAGAIFYRQQLLLMDEATTSWGGKKAIAETIAHEIAHQWFGNRVTMVWWDDLWLNEAFATWVSHKVVDEWQPSWRIWDDFQSMRRHAMALDALETTHPIYTEVESPGQATEMFDAITYYKGCCILRQLEAWIGAEPFRDGLRAYLKRFKDRNARGQDLWASLGATAGVDVARVATSWTEQEGLPLISIDASERGDRTVVRLSQRRFFSRPAAMEAKDSQRWAIPVQLRWSDGTSVHTERLLLDTERLEHELPGRAAWIHGNAEGIGFYRAELSRELLQRLADARRASAAEPQRGAGLPSKQGAPASDGNRPWEAVPHGGGSLTPVERQVLLDDLWAMVLCGRASIDAFLDLLATYRGEEDYVVLEALVGRLDALVHRLAAKSDLPRLRAFVAHLLSPALAKLGWEPEAGEDPARASARAVVVSGLGDLARDPSALRQAAALAEREREAPASVDANLAAVVVRLTGLRGDQGTLQTFVEEFERRRSRQASPEEQLRYLGGLASFERPAQARAILELSLTDAVPQESMIALLRPLLARPATTALTWTFLQERWEAIVSRAGLMQISRLVEGLGALPLSRRRQVESFFQAHPVEEARRALRQALEEMELRDELRRREAPRLSAWLARYSPTPQRANSSSAQSRT